MVIISGASSGIGRAILSRISNSETKAAVFNQFEVQRGLPINYLLKYFQQVPDGYELVQDIRRRVTFEEIMLDDGLWYTSGIESFISSIAKGTQKP